MNNIWPGNEDWYPAWDDRKSDMFIVQEESKIGEKQILDVHMDRLLKEEASEIREK